MVGISNTVLNKSGKSGHPCLVPYLRQNALGFSPLSIMLTADLSHIAFTMLKYVPFIPSF